MFWPETYLHVLLKYIPHKVDVPPIYLLIKKSHSSESRYFSRCLYMMFALVWMHFEVNFHISKPFGFSNIRRRWNRATSFGPLVFDIGFSWIEIYIPVFRPRTRRQWKMINLTSKGQRNPWNLKWIENKPRLSILHSIIREFRPSKTRYSKESPFSLIKDLVFAFLTASIVLAVLGITLMARNFS